MTVRKPTSVTLTQHAQDRLDYIMGTLGMTQSLAIRYALAVAARQLGHGIRAQQQEAEEEGSQEAPPG